MDARTCIRHAHAHAEEAERARASGVETREERSRERRREEVKGGEAEKFPNFPTLQMKKKKHSRLLSHHRLSVSFSLPSAISEVKKYSIN